MRLIDSTALTRCTRAPAWLMRRAAVVYVTVTMIARPWGTSATRTAAVWTIEAVISPVPNLAEAATTTATRTTRNVVAAINRSTPRWSGVRSVCIDCAWAVSWFA